MTVNPETAKKIPEKVKEAMVVGGSAVTCMPVKLDDGDDWEAVIYFRLTGRESEMDLQLLAEGVPRSIGLETDLIEHENATVVVLRLEVDTLKDNPLTGEILLTSGGASAHFEALKLLTSQSRLCWFFIDDAFRPVHSQQHTLSSEMHEEFNKLLKDATARDAVIRLTGKYDAHAAFASIVDHYRIRVSNASPQ